MASKHPTRAVSPDPESGASDLPLDHALSLLLADETENALRWGAAVLESGPWTPSALVVTARLLDQMGRKRAAIEGLNLAVQQATAEGNLPLAMAAIGDLRALGADVTEPLDRTAAAFCEGSERIRDAQSAPLLPQLGEFRPLSPFLTGPALASKAAQIVESARRAEGDVPGEAPPRIAPLPLFSALGKEPLQDLLAAFETLTVPAGHAVIREGEEEAAAYIVARGELEVSRRSSDGSGKPVVLARLGSGAFFGEMALLSQLPGAASVTATRPSILLVARREALEAVVEKHPDVAAELAAHCRRQSVANLGWASPVVVAIPARERAILVERFETRMFEAGDRLVESGEAPRGLHLVVSGEIAVVANEGGERVVLATLTAGETVGEVELVLCRNAAADAIAVRPTATLFLQRDEFFSLVQDHPAILHGLYGIAVRRHAETSLALEAGSATVSDEALLGSLADDFTGFVEDPFPVAEPVPTAPARITPLARGTLGTSRISSPRPSPLPPPPRSARPGARSTLPPPPMPAALSAPSSQPPLRRTLPPPIPPASRVRDTVPAPAAYRTASFAPVTAATEAGRAREAARKDVPPPSRTLGRVALFAAAAAAVAVSVRAFRDDAPPVPTTAAASLPQVAANAPPAAEALPTNLAPVTVTGTRVHSETAPQPPVPPAVQAGVARPNVGAAAALKRRTAPPAPVAAGGSRPTAAPAAPSRENHPSSRDHDAPDTSVLATAPATPQPSRASFAVAKPAPADQALTVGEFGGRE